MPDRTRNQEYQAHWSGRDVWHGRGLDPDDGLHQLSQQCLDEIDAALDLLARNPLPVLALDPDDFSMPACREAMAEVRRELDHGRGFVIIDRLDPETMDAGQMTAVYWLLARMVGRPVAQKWSDGRLLYDVTDLGRPSGNGVRPDVTNEEQSFHTDNSYNLCPPDHVGLLCRQPAMEGGMSRVVSMKAVANRMAEEHPDMMGRLYRPYYFDRQREHADGDVRYVANPVLSDDEGALRVRVSRNLIYQGYRLAGVEVDDESEEALAAWFSIVDDPRMYIEFAFQPGQIQFLNNRAFGHKRTGFRDWPEGSRKRHLVRVWLRDRGRRFYNG